MLVFSVLTLARCDGFYLFNLNFPPRHYKRDYKNNKLTIFNFLATWISRCEQFPLCFKILIQPTIVISFPLTLANVSIDIY